MTALVGVLRLGRPIRTRFALALAAGVATAGVAVALTATSAWLISRASEQPPVLVLMVAIVAVRAFGIARGVFRYVERLAAHDAAFRALAELRVHAYARLERLAPAGLEAYRSGDLLTRLVTDIDGLADLWLRVLLPYGAAAIVGAASALLVAMLVPGAGVALAVSLLAVGGLAPLVATRVAGRADARIAPLRGQLAGEALELVEGAEEIVVAGAASDRLGRLGAVDASVREAERRSAVGTGAGSFVSVLAAGAAVWLALALGIAAVATGELPGVMLAVAVLTPMAAHEVAAGLAPGAQRLVGLSASASRVSEVLDRPVPVGEPAVPHELPEGPLGLRISRMSAGYRPGHDVLRDIELELPPGGIALVTGPSGSGKSTLAAVLVGFLESSSGQVELVGPGGTVALRDLAGDDIRRAVGLCAQDVHVFDTNIAENVRLARPDADDQAIRAVLDRVDLGTWADTLPDGLGTMVGEHGAHLSGGQRQRLGLARALLADRRMVIFDEPTEHVDDAAADRLVADLLTASAGRTIILVTHQARVMAAIRPTVTLTLA